MTLAFVTGGAEGTGYQGLVTFEQGVQEMRDQMRSAAF